MLILSVNHLISFLNLNGRTVQIPALKQSIQHYNLSTVCEIKAASWRKRLVVSRIGAARRLGHFMWVSWWTKRSRGLDRFFSRCVSFFPTTNFIPQFLHIHLIHFLSFYFVTPYEKKRNDPDNTFQKESKISVRVAP